MNRKIEEEINQAYEQERLTWMRRQFQRFCLFSAIIAVLAAVAHQREGKALPDILHIAVFVAGYGFGRWWINRPTDIVRLAFWLVFAAGVVTFLIVPWLGRPLAGSSSSLKHPFEVFAPLAGFYFFACLFLPWTLKEAAKVLGILSALGVVAALIYASATWTQFLSLLFLPLAGLPGLGICWLRHSQFVSVQPTTAIASRCEPMRGLEAPLGDLVPVHGQFSKWMYGLRLHQLTKLRQRSGKIFIQSLVVARIGE